MNTTEPISLAQVHTSRENKNINNDKYSTPVNIDIILLNNNRKCVRCSDGYLGYLLDTHASIYQFIDCTFSEKLEIPDSSKEVLISYTNKPVEFKNLPKLPKKLPTLILENVKDIDFNKLPKMLQTLRLVNCDINTFKGMPLSVKELTVIGGKIRSFTGCSPWIQSLTLEDLEIKSFSTLHISGLKCFDCSNITGLQTLVGMPQVKFFTCTDMPDLRSLNGTRVLESMRITRAPIKEWGCFY